jgi:hypothetical protein
MKAQSKQSGQRSHHHRRSHCSEGSQQDAPVGDTRQPMIGPARKYLLTVKVRNDPVTVMSCNVVVG